MTDKIAIAVAGASGRMGRMLVQEIMSHEKVILAGVLERRGHAWCGQDLGSVMNGPKIGITVSDDADSVLSNAQAVIDFTAPEATLTLNEVASKTGTAHIIGTTGMTDADIKRLESASKAIPIVRAGNMSLGVNLLTLLTQKVAAALDEDFDIEIVEAHHNQKVDAPSGTALMLGEAAARGRKVELPNVRDAGRDGMTGARRSGDIGFSVIRGGDIVGEHDVLFAGPGERVILRHIATDRAVFARGAVKAAIWASEKTPGSYDMLDVLGFN